MKLTIEITSNEPLNRRRLNNLLANSQNEIFDFILNGDSEELSSPQKMGIKEYDLNIKIETNQ